MVITSKCKCCYKDSCLVVCDEKESDNNDSDIIIIPTPIETRIKVK